MKLEREKCCGELLRSEVHTSALEKGTYMPSQDDIAKRMLIVLSQLSPENLEAALNFAMQEAIQNIQGTSAASRAITGKQYP